MQARTTSCKTAGGMNAADGIRSVSKSMMNTVRVELTNSITPDLGWKVSKGYRSAPRRRKAADKVPKLGSGLPNKSAKSSSETTVSDSEKLGVAVLGRRFSDAIENVPIKKRRFMVRPPSPPSCLSPQSPKTKQLGVNSCSKSIFKKNATKSDTSLVTSFTRSAVSLPDSFTERTNEKPGYVEDFSGIEILAAAACNNSIHDGIGEVLSREETNASTSVRPPVASISTMPMTTDSEISEGRDASMDTIHYSPKDAVHEGKIEKSLEDSLVKTNTSDGDDTALASSKDVRFHWDLNVPMDTWEEPSDLEMVHTEKNAEDNVSIDRLAEKQPVSEDVVVKGSTEAKNPKLSPVIEDMEQEMKASFDSVSLAVEAKGSTEAKNPKLLPVIEDIEQEMEASLDPVTTYGKCNLADISLRSSKDAGEVTISSGRDVGNGTSPPSFGAELSETTCSGKIHVENPPLTCVSLVEGVSCEMGNTVVDDVGKGSGATSIFHDDSKSPEGSTAVESCHLQKSCLEVEPVGKPEDVIMPTSATSVGESVSMVTLIAKDQVKAASDATVESLQTGSPGVMAKSSASVTKDLEAVACSSVHEQCHFGDGAEGSKVTTVDSSGVNSHFHDKDRIVATTCPVEQEVGYDSQYEDGELRESYVPYWEENKLDEVERVDYGSDTCDTEVSDDSASGKVECGETEPCGIESQNVNMKVQGVQGFSLGSDNVCGKVEHCTSGNALKQSSVGSKTRTSGSEQLPDDTEASSNRTVETTVGCRMRKHNDDCSDGLYGKDLSKVDGSSGTLNRMRTSWGRRYDTNELSTLSEEVGSDYSMGNERSNSRIVGKSFGGVRMANPSKSYWESNHRGSAPYRGSFGSGRSRPRSGMDPDDTFSEAAELDGVHNRVRRQAMSYNSNRIYQPTFRRRSPDTFRGMIPIRDTSPDRRRLQRYPPGVGRGIRDYHRPFPDELNNSSYNGPRRMTRRELRTSPPGRGPYYGRPQSRGRSRSPVAWERNEVSQHRGSRSPDYRFDRKVERGRVPFQKNSFGPKYEAGFFSPPKRRFSPQNNSRWFDDRNGAGDHSFRGRGGGGRSFQPSQRFDSVRSRRPDSDDYFEPNVRPRFSELNNGGRECRFEGSDEDRRKPDGDHSFRGRGGGGRSFQPSQRFDSVRSRRPDSDDYFEPNVRPRFSELNNGGRECRFEGSDEDRRKPDGRFENVHRLRRYDSEGVVR